MIGPLEDQISALTGVAPGKIRSILLTTAFVLIIVAVGLRLFGGG